MHRKHRIPILSSCHTRKKRQLRKIDNTSHSIPRLSYSSLSKHNSSYYGIPIGCSIAFLLLGIVCINPTVYSMVDNSNVYAIEEDSELEEVDSKEELSNNTSNTNISTLSNDSIATLADTSDSGDNDSSAALIVDDGIIYDTILADAGSPVYKSHTITIKAANLESYVLQVSATNQGTSELVNRDNSSYKVAGVGTSGVLGKNIPSGKWGIGWGDTSVADENLTYYTLPAYGTTASNIQTGQLEAVSNLDGADVNSTKKLTLAANFSPDTVDGHYTTSLLLSLVVEPGELTTFPITTMQEMTPKVCASTSENTSKQLMDARDNKLYWVTKLKDNNCWMTQNLDLDLNKITLSSDNSDVTSNWTPNLTSALWKNAGANALNYYDPGFKFCITNGSCSLIASENDGHDAQGNLYSWGAATANQAASIAEAGESTRSICPKGWRLPPNSGDKSYANLLSSYSSQSIFISPLYFVRAGSVSGETLYNDGGHYWSATAGGSNGALYLNITGPTSYNPSNYYSGSRPYGYSVRCVAR